MDPHVWDMSRWIETGIYPDAWCMQTDVIEHSAYFKTSESKISKLLHASWTFNVAGHVMARMDVVQIYPGIESYRINKNHYEISDFKLQTSSNESKQYPPSTSVMRSAQFPSFHCNQAAVPPHDASANALSNFAVFEPLVNGRMFRLLTTPNDPHRRIHQQKHQFWSQDWPGKSADEKQNTGKTRGKTHQKTSKHVIRVDSAHSTLKVPSLLCHAMPGFHFKPQCRLRSDCPNLMQWFQYSVVNGKPNKQSLNLL